MDLNMVWNIGQLSQLHVAKIVKRYLGVHTTASSAMEHKMNFKIVKYHCGCKYVFTAAMPRPRICPEHQVIQKMITLWCENDDCGIKLEVTPLAGRRRRCNDCSAYKNKLAVRLFQQRKHNKKYGIEDEATPEMLAEKDERLLKECFSGWPLPVVETPILDRFLIE